jgi:hypothetical protein
LKLLTCADGVWAFKIAAPPERGANPSLPECAVSFPARSWEAETIATPGTRAAGAKAPGASRYARLEAADNSVKTRPVSVPNVPGLSWMLRMRGAGTIAAQLEEEGREGPARQILVDSDQWTWVTIPLNMTVPYGAVAGRFKHVLGGVDVDMISLIAGEWRSPAAGESVTLPASMFFHAGSTQPRTGEVLLTARRDPADVVFYGLRLPLEPGFYSAEMTFASAASNRVALGEWMAGSGKASEETPTRVVAGQRAIRTWMHVDNRPCELDFRFSGNADVRIRDVRLTRVN